MRKKNDDETRLHTRLPILRAERGWSRKDVAQAVGVHYQTIGYLERGEYNPSLILAMTIAARFDLPVDAVFSLTPFPPLSEQLQPRLQHDNPKG